MWRIQGLCILRGTEAGTGKNNARGGEKYSLRTTTDGRFVAVVDDDILANLDTEHWNSETKKAAQKAAAKALMKFSDGIVVNGITRKVNKVSRDEYTRSKDTIRLARNNPSAFADKMRAASAVDDVVIAATDWARDGGVIHPRSDKFVDFDHGKTLIEAGDSTYSAEVAVGITKNGDAVFYDVVDLTPVKFELKKEESHSAVTAVEPRNAITGDSSGDSIRKSSRNVNSVSDQTETENFKKWFGDWEKNPTKASKVVNEDGTPKVVYHGTNAELKGGAEYLKQVVQIQKKHHLPESAAFLPVTAPIRRRTGPAYRGPHGRRRRVRAGR